LVSRASPPFDSPARLLENSVELIIFILCFPSRGRTNAIKPASPEACDSGFSIPKALFQLLSYLIGFSSYFLVSYNLLHIRNRVSLPDPVLYHSAAVGGRLFATAARVQNLS
jgi:hypothetical protein